MVTRRRGEYYRITINSQEKTVLLFRDEMEFDKEFNETNAKKWIVYINKFIKNVLNTEDWEYLGEMETYHPEKNTQILYITEEII